MRNGRIAEAFAFAEQAVEVPGSAVPATAHQHLGGLKAAMRRFGVSLPEGA